MLQALGIHRQSTMPFIPTSSTLWHTFRTPTFLGLGLTSLSFAAIFRCIILYNRFRTTQSQRLTKLATLESLQLELEDRQRTSAALKKQLEGLTTELELERDKVGEQGGELREAKLELSGSKKEVEKLKKEHESLKSKHVSLSASYSDLSTAYGALKDTHGQMKHELGYLRKTHADTLVLLEQRTAEVKGAEAFLGKTDRVSGKEIVELVEGLNGEILQVAAIMAESFNIEKKDGREERESSPEEGGKEEGQDADSEELREAMLRTEEVLGGRMTELLKQREHHDDPILIQLAFQGALAAYTHWIISSWWFENPEDEHMLSEIYARVRESEEQAVSGRWRQLTRAHLQRMMTTPPDLSVDIADACTQILITAGKKISSPSALHAEILAKHKEQLQFVISCAQKLNRTIGEGITSCDLEALYIGPDVAFNPGTMEDDLGGNVSQLTTNEGEEEDERDETDDRATTPTPLPRNARQQKVLCTTDLGLVRAEKVVGKTGEWHESVLLKPKVVLPLAISDLLS